MNENSNTYAISTLKRRRAEIDGEIKACELQLRGLNEALCHLDATLALFDPDYDPALVRPKRLFRRAKLFGGRKLTGLILDARRRTERPLTTQEVVSVIAAKRMAEAVRRSESAWGCDISLSAARSARKASEEMRDGHYPRENRRENKSRQVS